MANDIQIKNRKAGFEYTFLEKFIAGLVLTGTEIKSIRGGKSSIAEAFCILDKKGEAWVRNMQIEPYEKGGHYNHEPKRIANRLKDQGITLIPLRVFINDRGFAKMEIALGKGKKLYDKRESIKKRDTERDLGRKLK
jgi:SsrA-binding protein